MPSRFNTVLESLAWFALMSAVLAFGACPLAGRVLEWRTHYLSGPEGQAHLEREIELKILERYGAEALQEYQAGQGHYLGAVNDVVLTELYALPVLTFLLVTAGGVILTGPLYRLSTRTCERYSG